MVPVVTTWSTGLSSPVFVIRKGDVYYLTATLWEYDPNATGGDPDKIAGVAALENQFNQAADTNLQVRELPGGVQAGGGDYTNGNLGDG
jgi:hypothetical protein